MILEELKLQAEEESDETEKTDDEDGEKEEW